MSDRSRRPMSLVLVATLPLVALPVAARRVEAQRRDTAVTALRFRALVDGSGRSLRDAVVVVRGDRITAVGTGDRAIPSGARLIDLRRYTALAGLIDAHTHMTYYWDGTPGTNPWQQQARATRRSPSSSRRRTHAARWNPGSPRCAISARATSPTSPCGTSSTVAP
jgi:hypothetical protein